MTLIALGCICAWAMVIGKKEAVLWSRKGTDAYSYDEHVIFIIERIAVLLVFASGFAIGFKGNVWDGIVVAIVAIFMFPFFHNGMYYRSRNDIDGSYPKGFWDEPSKTSTADINFSRKQRVGLMIIGTVQMLGYLIAKTWM